MLSAGNFATLALLILPSILCQNSQRSGQFNRIFSNFRSNSRSETARAVSGASDNNNIMLTPTKTTSTERSTTPRVRVTSSTDRDTSVSASPGEEFDGLYYSWRDPTLGRHVKYTWRQAERTCTARGQRLVSLQTGAKNSHVLAQVERDNIEYIWTSGERKSDGRNFVWATGEPVLPLAWSLRGAIGRPQPDNREGDENCLAVLNRFYPGDGITWHDVACDYRKPFVCE